MEASKLPENNFKQQINDSYAVLTWLALSSSWFLREITKKSAFHRGFSALPELLSLSLPSISKNAVL